MVRVENRDNRPLGDCGVELKIGENQVPEEKWAEMAERPFIKKRLNSKPPILVVIGSNAVEKPRQKNEPPETAPAKKPGRPSQKKDLGPDNPSEW